jgi:predicted enzyme related to lactoylglutathione lyase
MARDALLGRFVWHELLTTDTDAAAAFYKKVVGWKTAPWPHGTGYTLFVAGEGAVAGLMTLPEEAKKMGAPPNWLSYIGVESVDVAAARVEKLGGRILKPAEDIPRTGRYGVVMDPQGAVFGLYSPPQPPAGASRPKLGEFSWHELANSDQSAALTFYQELFGWEKTSSMEMGPEMGSYDMFGLKGVPMGGMFKRPPNVPTHWLPYAMVPDSKKAAKTVGSLGAKIINGPMQVSGGDWIVMGIDLQGAAFAVHSLKPAIATKPVKKSTAKKAVARRAAAKRPVAKKSAKAAKKPSAARGARRGTPVKKAVGKAKNRRAAKPKRKARR